MTTSLETPNLSEQLNLNPIIIYILESNKAEPSLALNSSALNKTTLAEAAGVTWQTINKAEMGLYSTLPLKLVNYMAANPVGNADHRVDSWNKLYADFIKREMLTLKANIDKGSMEVTALFTQPKDLATYYPSFTEWRESLSYSQIDFCKTFLLHQAIVSKYEAGLMKNLPDSIVDRLTYIGASNAYINALEKLPTKAKRVVK